MCDFRAFPRAPSFMGFVGLVPSEHSTGEGTRRGSITKAGDAHVRRVLVEAAWAYRHRPAVGYELRRRQEGQPSEVLAHSWATQLRLCARFHRMVASGKKPTVAATAVARELAGFVWALMSERYELMSERYEDEPGHGHPVRRLGLGDPVDDVGRRRRVRP